MRIFKNNTADKVAKALLVVGVQKVIKRIVKK
jgi:hypothetical protein